MKLQIYLIYWLGYSSLNKIKKMAARIAVKLILFYFCGVGDASIVFFTNENIGEDTETAGVPRIHYIGCAIQVLRKFQNGVQDSGVEKKLAGFSDVYPKN